MCTGNNLTGNKVWYSILYTQFIQLFQQRLTVGGKAIQSSSELSLCTWLASADVTTCSSSFVVTYLCGMWQWTAQPLTVFVHSCWFASLTTLTSPNIIMCQKESLSCIGQVTVDLLFSSTETQFNQTCWATGKSTTSSNQICLEQLRARLQVQASTIEPFSTHVLVQTRGHHVSG